MVSALVVGATGHIGGTALTLLRDQFPSFEFTAILRSASVAPAFQSLGIKTLISTSVGEVEDASQSAEVVYNFADADNVEITRAIIAGLTARKLSGKSVGLLIHTSGTGVFNDNSKGTYVERNVVSDANEADIRAIRPDALHRNVDQLIFDADTRGDLSGYIISPSLVYGEATGPIRRATLPTRMLIEQFMARKEVVYLGDGTNTWRAVHVEDLAELYALLTNHALSQKPGSESSYAKYYIAAPTPFVMKDLFNAYAEALYKHGKVEKPVARGVKPEDAPDIMWLWGSNHAYAVGDRAYAIGWKPRNPDYLSSVATDVKIALREIEASGKKI